MGLSLDAYHLWWALNSALSKFNLDNYGTHKYYEHQREGEDLNVRVGLEVGRRIKNECNKSCEYLMIYAYANWTYNEEKVLGKLFNSYYIIKDTLPSQNKVHRNFNMTCKTNFWSGL